MITGGAEAGSAAVVGASAVGAVAPLYPAWVCTNMANNEGECYAIRVRQDETVCFTFQKHSAVRVRQWMWHIPDFSDLPRQPRELLYPLKPQCFRA